MNSITYHRPASLEEAWNLKGKTPGARFIAGGTDLLVQVKNGELKPEALISLRSIPELLTIQTDSGSGVRIGASVTIGTIVEHPGLRRDFPLLVDAARHIGSIQIRNVATIGGNISNCSPCADMGPPLLVLEARVRLQNSRASRDIPVQEFFKGPGISGLTGDEILTEILIDPPGKKAKAVFMKKGRVKMDLAVASIAIRLEMDGDGKRCRRCRIAAGSVAPVPLRLQEAEALLEGSVITRDLLDEAVQAARESVSPITDVRSSEEYRRHIIGVYLKRGIESLLGWSGE